MAKTPPPHNPDFDPDRYPYPLCREQHHWQPYNGAIDKKTKTGHRIQKCKNCPKKRVTTIDIDPLSDTYSRRVVRYRSPADYRVPGGLDSHDRGLLIVRNFMRELAEGYDAEQE